MNKIISILFTLLIWFLSYIIPKKSSIYVFWGEHWKDFLWNAKALYLYIKQNNSDIKTYFLTLNKILIQNNNNFVYQYSLKWILILLRWKFLISGWWIKSFFPLYFTFWKFNYISLWHWDTYKKLWFENKIYKSKNSKFWFFLYKFNQNFTKLFTTWNKFNVETFNKTFFINNTKITGLARNDIFFKWYEYFECYDVLNLLWIKEYKKIILYTPTWRDNNIFKAFSEKFLVNLNNYLIKNNFVFLIKMHPITKDRIETNKYKNIKDITDYKFDVQELLKYTNYLIVDYSSISIDFYLTDRPVIYYPYDEKQYYLKDRDMYFKYKDISIKETTTNNEFQLLKIIENIEIISKNENYIKKYNEFKNFWHFYKDWWYCERILKEIKKIK